MKLKLQLKPGCCEAGCDEAGRGSLSGPVFAAAVILPDTFFHPKLNDSKQLTPEVRNELTECIRQNALAWAVASVDEATIDKINILNASIMAMHKALDQLPFVPDFITVDGNRFKPWKNVPYSCEIKGDARFMHVAAAGILAKTARDAFMEKLHHEFPQYGWNKNKGYATKEHRDALLRYGYSPYHRKTFILKAVQGDLFD